MSEHWLEHAHGRIVAGDSEPDVLADYGWVQITDEERAAMLHFSGHYAGFYGRAMHRLAMRLGLYDLPRDTPDTQATLGEGSVQAQCTLTDAEREAVETAVRWLEPYPQVASTLRKLLERIGGER